LIKNIIKVLGIGFCLLVIFQLNGCVNANLVTQRPVYAYPQNLTSLCENPVNVFVVNKGRFVTADYTNKSSALLLSPQLLQLEPAVQRQLTHVQLTVSSTHAVSIRAYGRDGMVYDYMVPEEDFTCDEQGELLLHYPDNGFYFWASYGSKKRELALWTNSAGDLVVQNRWLETQSGLVSGKVSGDAWALFAASQPLAETDVNEKVSINVNTLKNTSGSNEGCRSLSGTYQTIGDLLTPDGQFLQRSATEQFFRKEIIGEHPVNQTFLLATKLIFESTSNGDVIIQLFNESELLVSRKLAAKNLSCKQGRWFYDGEVKGESPWLLVIASGGVNWENLTLWQDDRGDLLLDGLYKTKGLLMLIPFGRTEKTFIAFPKYVPEL
jgi:hypothetical protein